MMRKLFLIVFSWVSVLWMLPAQTPSYREALKLYERGMYGRSRMMFDDMVSETERKADPAGYSLLCDIRSNVPGYVNRIDVFLLEYPYSVLIPQVRFYHALNLFDADDYAGAAEQFGLIEEKSLYRSQRTEYVFKKAYCELEKGNLQLASEGFKSVEAGRFTDYTSPSRYAIGYIEYNLKHFTEAISWFEKSAQDNRFKELSDYYIFECRFLLKD